MSERERGREKLFEFFFVRSNLMKCDEKYVSSAGEEEVQQLRSIDDLGSIFCVR